MRKKTFTLTCLIVAAGVGPCIHFSSAVLTRSGAGLPILVPPALGGGGAGGGGGIAGAPPEINAWAGVLATAVGQALVTSGGGMLNLVSSTPQAVAGYCRRVGRAFGETLANLGDELWANKYPVGASAGVMYLLETGRTRGWGGRAKEWWTGGQKQGHGKETAPKQAKDEKSEDFDLSGAAKKVIEKILHPVHHREPYTVMSVINAFNWVLRALLAVVGWALYLFNKKFPPRNPRFTNLYWLISLVLLALQGRMKSSEWYQWAKEQMPKEVLFGKVTGHQGMYVFATLVLQLMKYCALALFALGLTRVQWREVPIAQEAGEAGESVSAAQPSAGVDDEPTKTEATLTRKVNNKSSGKAGRRQGCTAFGGGGGGGGRGWWGGPSSGGAVEPAAGSAGAACIQGVPETPPPTWGGVGTGSGVDENYVSHSSTHAYQEDIS